MSPPALNLTMAPASVSTKSPSFRVGLGDITHNNVGQIKRLNTTLFPVVYAPSFYKDIQRAGEYAKIIYFNDICVGAVCCRKEPVAGSPTLQNLYIMTLGILAPYRRLGLGTRLLNHILEQARLDQGSEPKITKVFLHVQSNNEDALEFYKQHGFQVAERIEKYYPHFQPSDAYKLEWIPS